MKLHEDFKWMMRSMISRLRRFLIVRIHILVNHFAIVIDGENLSDVGEENFVIRISGSSSNLRLAESQISGWVSGMERF